MSERAKGNWSFDGRDVYAMNGGGDFHALNVARMMGPEKLRAGNAALIAAAPEMLAALEGVMDNITSSVASRAAAFKEATRVINKAKGIQ